MKRKYADKRAGNMLDRPSLLLNLNDNPGVSALVFEAPMSCVSRIKVVVIVTVGTRLSSSSDTNV